MPAERCYLLTIYATGLQRVNVAGCPLEFMAPSQQTKLAQSRRSALDDLAKDRDPAIERKIVTEDNTVNAVLDNYVDRVLGTKRSKPGQTSAFDRLVRPRCGSRSIYDLTRADMAKLFDSIEDSSGPVMADRTLAYLRKAFNWQQARDQNFISPDREGHGANQYQREGTDANTH